MEYSEKQKVKIKDFLKKFDLDTNKVLNQVGKDKWTAPIKNFPLNTSRTKSIDAVLQFEPLEGDKINVKVSPKSKIHPKSLIISNEQLNALGIKEAKAKGTFVLYNPDKGTSFDATIEPSKNGYKMVLKAHYGNSMPFAEFQKEFGEKKFHAISDIQQVVSQASNKNQSHKEAKSETGLNIKSETNPNKGHSKSRINIDPMIQTDLLLNNLSVLMKSAVSLIPLDEKFVNELKNRLNSKKASPYLSLSEIEKSDLKAYIEGNVKNQDHVTGLATTNQDKSINLSESDKNNLRAYLGNPKPLQQDRAPVNSKDLDAYIVNLKEMMDNNVHLPKGFPPTSVSNQVSAALDMGSSFKIDDKLNKLTMENFLEKEKVNQSSHNISLGLPKSKSKSMSL